ncbi:hypothetical protein BT69DRAFT_1290610 [Atractiella rhizophila]|nr:hypothetical protein BT69DRAFT_1290610 [Atractiella rhizophila]
MAEYAFALGALAWVIHTKPSLHPSNTAPPLFLPAGGEASIDPPYRSMAGASDFLKVAGWESDLRSLPERSR